MFVRSLKKIKLSSNIRLHHGMYPSVGGEDHNYQHATVTVAEFPFHVPRSTSIVPTPTTWLRSHPRYISAGNCRGGSEWFPHCPFVNTPNTNVMWGYTSRMKMVTLWVELYSVMAYILYILLCILPEWIYMYNK